MSDEIKNPEGDGILDEAEGSENVAAETSADAVKKSNGEKKEKGKKPAKQKAPSKGNIFKRMGKGITRFFKDFKGEIKKIIWPGRQMVLKSTGVVLAAVLVIGAGIWIVDYAISGSLDLLRDAAANRAAATTAVSAETTAASDSSEETTAADTADTTDASDATDAASDTLATTAE